MNKFAMFSFGLLNFLSVSSVYAVDLVVFGHGSFHIDEKEIIVPANTTITLYGPPGSTVNKKIGEALAAGYKLKREHLVISLNFYEFYSERGWDIPNISKDEQDMFRENFDYPKTFYSGDSVPNFYVKASEPLGQVPGEGIMVLINEEEDPVYLKQIFETYKGADIHWSPCPFNAAAPAYGFHISLKSELAQKLTPVISEEEKRKKRQNKFGVIEKENKRYHPYK